MSNSQDIKQNVDDSTFAQEDRENAQIMPVTEVGQKEGVSEATAGETAQGPQDGMDPLTGSRDTPTIPEASTATSWNDDSASVETPSVRSTPVTQHAQPLRAEDESGRLARAMLARGAPPPPDDEAERSKNAGLVHAASVLLRLEYCGKHLEMHQFKQIFLQVWDENSLYLMRGHLVRTDDAAPSRVEMRRTLRAFPTLQSQHVSENRYWESGLTQAAYTFIRLQRASDAEPQLEGVARQVRVLAAEIWADDGITDMIAFLKDIGKEAPAWKEEERYERAMRGEQPPQHEHDSNDGEDVEETVGDF